MTENPSKALVPHDAGTALDRPAGVDTLSREDFRLPILRIVQPQTQEVPEGFQGHYLNNITGQAKPYLIAAVLRVTKTRILWPEGFSRDSEPICASDDSIAPRAKFIGAGISDWGQSIGNVSIPDLCEKCPLKDWGEILDKPPCALSYKYIIVDLDDGMPGLLTLSRTAVGSARALNTLLAVPGLKKLRIFTELVTSDKGKWYAFRYMVVGPPEKEDWDLIHLIAPLAMDATVTAELGTEDLEGQHSRQSSPSEDEEPTPFPEDDNIPF